MRCDDEIEALIDQIMPILEQHRDLAQIFLKKEEAAPDGPIVTMADPTNTASVDASASADRVSWGKRFAAGIAAGMLSAILMMGFMMTYSNAIGVEGR